MTINLICRFIWLHFAHFFQIKSVKQFVLIQIRQKRKQLHLMPDFLIMEIVRSPYGFRAASVQRLYDLCFGNISTENRKFATRSSHGLPYDARVGTVQCT